MFLDLGHSLLQGLLVSPAVHDDSIILGDNNVLGHAQDIRFSLVQLEPDLFRDDGASGENGYVVHNGLPIVSEGRGLDHTYL